MSLSTVLVREKRDCDLLGYPLHIIPDQAVLNQPDSSLGPSIDLAVIGGGEDMDNS